MAALPKLFYSLEEYLELDKNSEERFEYFDGEVFAVGGSLEHAAISNNVGAVLREKLRGRPCRVLSSDARIKVPKAWPYRYPDVVVVCGRLVSEEMRGQEMLVNPRLIVEVLSPSTEAYDYGTKFKAYQSIESFCEYLLVAQDRPYVAHHVRQPGGKWLRDDIEGLESEVTLESLGVTLPLSEIYLMVEFPTQPEAHDKEIV